MYIRHTLVTFYINIDNFLQIQIHVIHFIFKYNFVVRDVKFIKKRIFQMFKTKTYLLI